MRDYSFFLCLALISLFASKFVQWGFWHGTLKASREWGKSYWALLCSNLLLLMPYKLKLIHQIIFIVLSKGRRQEGESEEGENYYATVTKVRGRRSGLCLLFCHFSFLCSSQTDISLFVFPLSLSWFILFFWGTTENLCCFVYFECTQNVE